MTSTHVAAVGRSTSLSPSASFCDLLLEALSYLQDSSWRGFEAAYEAVDAIAESEMGTPREAARVLSALGHIDLENDPRTLRPTAWSAAPPTLLAADTGEWLLCGERPTALVEALIKAASGHRLTVSIEQLPSQPARIAISDNSAGEAILDVAAELEAADYPLELNPYGAISLARALPTLQDVVESLHHSMPPHGGAIETLVVDERSRLRWQAAVDVDRPGAYRFDPPPLMYAFVSERETTPARVDARLARLLALLEEGFPPLAWDATTRVATAAYYAEPPGLYERALVLSSGYGPQPAPYERVTRYRDVSEAVGTAVYSRLVIWRKEEHA
jgi:hypothetical protein